MSALWQTKLAAWLHDPAEKALVLLRDPAGHEGGTVRVLRETLRPLLAGSNREAVKRGDHWAAAADRPQWPRDEKEGRYAAWSQVDFSREPVITHPLSGQSFSLGDLEDAHVEALKAVSLDHFLDLAALGGNDPRLTFLALWRFGPETPAGELDKLWQMLPADTRTPDHTIWNHLDMVSALAGAQAGAQDGDQPALLAMSFGPVQGFISQARSTSDLWAGSHLLSSLVWEGLKTLAGECGPDAVVFPQLRGLAAVDAWLLDEAATAGQLDAWRKRIEAAHPGLIESASDANPLFAAALPNKFLAIVPASRAEDIARRIETAVRDAAKAWALDAARRIMDNAETHWPDQIEAQLEGFPEVHWAIADWPQAVDDDGLKATLAAFVPEGEGFFAGNAWSILSRDIEVEGTKFYTPNPGILYPAVFEVAERALATAKTCRPFAQRPQAGYRCTLCGEREWLSPDAGWLASPPGERAALPGNPWAALATEHKFGVKQGEHLCALCALKRLWPTRFAERVGRLVGKDVGRYVVSTHTMALATTLEKLAEAGATLEGRGKLQALAGVTTNQEIVALPRRLLRTVLRSPESDILRRLPAAFDAARESENEARFDELSRRVKDITGTGIETYYGLIQMDGDRMGAWLTGEFATTFGEAWHPRIRTTVKQRFGDHATLQAYLKEKRPPSPGRHLAISQALGDFAAKLAPHIVEDLCKGKLLYAGGDDVLAMVSVDDLPRAMLLLRLAYSGIGMDGLSAPGLRLAKGFGILDGRLMRLMGGRATASMGAVIAHHQAPLAAVLRSLREAEGRAKAAGRNAFCLRVVKRGGGEVGFTAPWWPEGNAPAAIGQTPFGLLLRTRDALIGQDNEDTGLSRRAVYLAREWLVRLPDWPGAGKDADWQAMTANRLALQLVRQGGDGALAADLVATACRLAEKEPPGENSKRGPREILDDLLSSAEFLAREVRAASNSTTPKSPLRGDLPSRGQETFGAALRVS
ncbi:MAG: type III-B CRISPR-associated protein Cas10/Cmr2 [Rhodocyclaceae bacterium]|nr:type III-B CRISPR-associated protein Cas10/Cmr2 [Rhodocyclaceae bacterium]